MKLQFKRQQFQEDATNAVCDVFEGQPKQTGASWGLGWGGGGQGLSTSIVALERFS